MLIKLKKIAYVTVTQTVYYRGEKTKKQSTYAGNQIILNQNHGCWHLYMDYANQKGHRNHYVVEPRIFKFKLEDGFIHDDESKTVYFHSYEASDKAIYSQGDFDKICLRPIRFDTLADYSAFISTINSLTAEEQAA